MKRIRVLAMRFRCVAAKNMRSGKLVFDRELEALIPVTEKDEDNPEEYLSQDEYYEEMGADFETFHASYELPDGQEVVAFGYYGYDG